MIRFSDGSSWAAFVAVKLPKAHFGGKPLA